MKVNNPAVQKLISAFAVALIVAIVLMLVQAFSNLHKYDLFMYQHNAQVFLQGGDLYADSRNFIPPPAILPILPLAFMGVWVKQFQVSVTLGALFLAVTWFSKRWGKAKLAPILLAGLILSFPFIDTMSQGHLGGWTLLGYTLALLTLNAQNRNYQAIIGAVAFSLVLIKPQSGLFVALSLLMVTPWFTRLTMLISYALQWLVATVATGGLFSVSLNWLNQLSRHANKYPNLTHDVSPRAIIRNFVGVEWQFLSYGLSIAVLIFWGVMVWYWYKKQITSESLLIVSVPMGYWFSPYHSNYDLLPIAAVMFVWMAIKYPKITLAFYVVYTVHWFFILVNDYGPGIVQSAPGWVLFTLLAVILILRQDFTRRKAELNAT